MKSDSKPLLTAQAEKANHYTADNYCTKYDETTGICPDGDE
nr:PREDICTED: RING finger protein unkempt-like [Linepithema humile]